MAKDNNHLQLQINALIQDFNALQAEHDKLKSRLKKLESVSGIQETVVVGKNVR